MRAFGFPLRGLCFRLPAHLPSISAFLIRPHLTVPCRAASNNLMMLDALSWHTHHCQEQLAASAYVAAGKNRNLWTLYRKKQLGIIMPTPTSLVSPCPYGAVVSSRCHHLSIRCPIHSEDLIDTASVYSLFSKGDFTKYSQRPRDPANPLQGCQSERSTLSTCNPCYQ